MKNYQWITGLLMNNPEIIAAVFFIAWFNAYPFFAEPPASAVFLADKPFYYEYLIVGSVLYGLTLIILPYTVSAMRLFNRYGCMDRGRKHLFITIFYGVFIAPFIIYSIIGLAYTIEVQSLPYEALESLIPQITWWVENYNPLIILYYILPFFYYLLAGYSCLKKPINITWRALIYGALTSAILFGLVILTKIVDYGISATAGSDLAQLIYLRGIHYLYNAYTEQLLLIIPTWGSLLYLYLARLVISKFTDSIGSIGTG